MMKTVLITCAVACGIAGLSESLRRLATAPFRCLINLLGGAVSYLRHQALPWLDERITASLREIDLGGDRFKLTFLLGALLHVLIFLVFSAADFFTVLASLEAIGLPVTLPSIPISLELMLAAATVGSAAYLIWTYELLSPDQPSHLYPEIWMGDSARKLYRRLSLVGALAAAVVIIALGAQRAHSLIVLEDASAVAVNPKAPLAAADLLDRALDHDVQGQGGDAVPAEFTAAEPDGSSWISRWVKYLSMPLLAVAILLAATVALPLGPAALKRLLPVILFGSTKITCYTAERFAAGLRFLLNVVLEAFSTFLDLVFKVCLIIARPPVRLVRLISHAAKVELRKSGSAPAWRRLSIIPLAGLLYSVTAFQSELEVENGEQLISRVEAPTPATPTT